MRIAARALALSTTALVVVGLTPGISHAANAHVTAQSPAPGSTKTVPTEVKVTFDGDVAPPPGATAPTFTVTRTGGANGFSCPAGAIAGPQSFLSCPVSGITDGEYTVTYHVEVVPAPPGVPAEVNESYVFTLDRVAPNAPVITQITPSPYVKSNATALTKVTVKGTAETASNVAVTLLSNNAGAQTKTVAADSVTGAFTAVMDSIPADGTLSATATATDAAGNTSPVSGALTATKDTVNPAVTTTAPANGGSEKGLSNASPVGIVVNASEPLATSTTVTIKDAGNNQVATASPTTGASQVNAVPAARLPEGTYTAVIHLVDVVGNVAPNVVQSFTIDDTAPGTPTLTPPGAINDANKTAYSLSGTGEPGMTIQALLTDSHAATQSFSTTVSASNAWSFTNLDVHGLVDGGVQIAVTQLDAATNASPTVSAVVTKDTVRPVVQAAAFDKAMYKAAPTVTAVVSGTVTDDFSGGDLVTVSVDDTDATTAPIVKTGTTDSLGAYAVSIDITALKDGPLSATVTARDPFGNTSLAPATASAAKDTGLPATPTVVVTNPINANNQTSVTITGVTEKLATLTATIDDADANTPAIVLAPVTADNVTGTYTFSGVDLSSLSDTSPSSGGGIRVQVVATDSFGNQSGTGQATVVKDTVAPAVPTLTVPAWASAATASAVPIAGTTEAGALVTLTLSDTYNPAHVVTGTVTALGDGTFTKSFNLTGFVDGAVQVIATAEDAAGNDSQPAFSSSMIKDTLAPAQADPLTATPAAIDYAHRTSDLTISGTAAAGDRSTSGLLADITLVDGSNATADLTKTNVPVTVTSGAFSWTFPTIDVTKLADGDLVASVVLHDPAGNVGTVRTLTVVKDTLKLAIGTVAPVDKAVIQPPSTVTVTFNEPVTATVNPNTPPYTRVDVKDKNLAVVFGQLQFAPDGKTLTFTPQNALTDALSPYSVVVHATDQNDPGDVVNQTTTFTVDTTAPVAPVISTVTNPVTQAALGTMDVTGTAEKDSWVRVTTTDHLGGSTFGVVLADATTGAWTLHVTVTSLAEGALTVAAHATDKAGNVGPDATKSSFKDTVAPAITGLAGTDTSYLTPATSLTGHLDDAVSTVTTKATDGTHIVTGAALVGSDGAFGGTLNLSGFLGGTVLISVTATDAVGNARTASAFVTHDAAVPAGAPTGAVAVPGDRKAKVSFTAPAVNGGAPITSYVVTSSPGGITATGASSPIVVTGLTNGVDYTFTVRAVNRAGAGAASAASTSVTPLGISTVTLGTVPSKVVYGMTVTFRGTLTRTDTSAPVGPVFLLGMRDNGVIEVLGSALPSSTGAVAITLRPGVNRVYELVYAGDAKNLDTESVALRRVLVATRLTAATTTGSHLVNAIVTGKAYPAKPGVAVRLYKLTSTGSRVLLQTVKLSSTSTYKFSVRLPKGYTHLVVLIGATPNNAAGSVGLRAYRT